jgi:hypothetical protein
MVREPRPRSTARRRPCPATRAATAVLVAALGACGGGGAPGTTPPGTGAAGSHSSPAQVIPPARNFGDACRLLSAAGVQAALGGGPLVATSEVNSQLGSYCHYVTSDARADQLLTVQVIVHGSAAEARDAVDQLGASPLTGVGDVARYSTLAGAAHGIDLARGATEAVVTTVEDVPQADLVHLAVILAHRL